VFPKTCQLTFLIGFIKGDGNITVYPRTEGLTLALNSKYPQLIKYLKLLLRKIFNKKPATYQKGNCVWLRIYQKNLSKRLNIPSGNKGKRQMITARWIYAANKPLIAYLRGLFEAEGSLSIHLPTCTYNFQFSNRNPFLLKEVSQILKKLGFHPECRKYTTRLRKRGEVLDFKKLISFRKYGV